MATLTHQPPHIHFLSNLPLRTKPRTFSPALKTSLQESPPSLAVVGVTNTERELLKKTSGVYIIDDRSSNTFPTPLDVSNKDDVAVGRIRQYLSQDANMGLDIFVCGEEIKYAKELL